MPGPALARGVTFIAALVALCAPARGVQAEPDAPTPTADEAQEPGQRQRPRLREVGGPNSVQRSIERETGNESVFDMTGVQRWTAPYVDWKRRVKEQHGLSFSLSAHLLAQQASETLSGRRSGFGGIYRFQGTWVAFARESDHPGQLDWRLESRARIGGSQAPTELGADAGAAALNSANGYSADFGTDFGVFSWTQFLADRRVAVVVGRMAFDVYQDAFLFQGFSRGFLNRGFFFNPTIATTGVGALGIVARGAISDHVWLSGQVFDGNAQSGSFDLDTVRQREWLKNVEIGWTPSLDRFETDKIQLTYWEKDARAEAGVSAGQGWAVSGSFQASERTIPFLRFGHSDGGAGAHAESSAALGMELTTAPSQAWSLGFAWARPSADTYGPGLRDEYAIETSYKLQLTPSISLTPDVQLLIDPAENPDQDRIWILGLRMILST